MAKKCFLSFHYKPDSWRVSQIKQIGSIEEQPILAANEWEQIKQKGDETIKHWIRTNMKGKECLVVLIGAETAERPWVRHEIRQAWSNGIGVFGIHIHNLKNSDGKQSLKGTNPFIGLFVDGEAIAGTTYDPPYTDSTEVYDYIKSNIEDWVADAVRSRR